MEKLVFIRLYSQTELGVLIRETKTQYIVKADSEHFERKFRKSDMCEINSIDNRSISFPTDEQIEVFRTEQKVKELSNELSKFNFRKLSLVSLEKILEITNTK